MPSLALTLTSALLVFCQLLSPFQLLLPIRETIWKTLQFFSLQVFSRFRLWTKVQFVRQRDRVTGWQTMLTFSILSVCNPIAFWNIIQSNKVSLAVTGNHICICISGTSPSCILFNMFWSYHICYLFVTTKGSVSLSLLDLSAGCSNQYVGIKAAPWSLAV